VGVAKISDAEVRTRLKDLPGWEATPAGIRKTFTRRDFKDAIRFVNAVAELAEEANHHPDILLSGWNKVTLTLMTHSEKAITEKDLTLAGRIERVGH
jgi:4a-hydroxytetrahydrobiopterin dehydratase